MGCDSGLSRQLGTRLRTGGVRVWAGLAGFNELSKIGRLQWETALAVITRCARELMANDLTDWREFRPDILGTVSVGHDGDAWTMAIYFTSEVAAREGEQKEPPPEMQAMDALTIGEPAFFDLKDP